MSQFSPKYVVIFLFVFFTVACGEDRNQDPPKLSLHSEQITNNTGKTANGVVATVTGSVANSPAARSNTFSDATVTHSAADTVTFINGGTVANGQSDQISWQSPQEADETVATSWLFPADPAEAAPTLSFHLDTTASPAGNFKIVDFVNTGTTDILFTNVVAAEGMPINTFTIGGFMNAITDASQDQRFMAPMFVPSTRGVFKAGTSTPVILLFADPPDLWAGGYATLNGNLYGTATSTITPSAVPAPDSFVLCIVSVCILGIIVRYKRRAAEQLAG